MRRLKLWWAKRKLEQLRRELGHGDRSYEEWRTGHVMAISRLVVLVSRLTRQESLDKHRSIVKRVL
jgi:hypothetical protein